MKVNIRIDNLSLDLFIFSVVSRVKNHVSKSYNVKDVYFSLNEDSYSLICELTVDPREVSESSLISLRKEIERIIVV